MIRLALAALMLATSAHAEPLSGLPYITDADTITISGTRIRLAGIDAPEMGQTCLDASGRPYRCGVAAREALTAFAAGKEWTCELLARPDRYGRRVGVCYVPETAGASAKPPKIPEVSINAWLVRQGWALDWPRYSHGRYAVDQEAARGARRGIWAGRFVEPWRWRHGECEKVERGLCR